MPPTGERIFGVWTLTFLVIANMIGAGVFTTSGFTLASLGSPSLVLLAWLAGGLIALCGAFSYGQLVRRMPISGGEYAFLSRAAPPVTGFVAGWVSMLAGFSGAIAFAAVTLEAYVPTPLPPRTLAVVVVLIGAAAHGLNRAAGTWTQNAAVLIKLSLLLIFLAVSAWSFSSGRWEGHDLGSGAGAGSPLLLFAQALVWISLSYSGFNAGVYVAGESVSPRTVARALLAGTAITTGLYLLLNWAFVFGPPPESIAGRADVAAQAARWIGGDGLATFVRCLIALALFTSVLSMMMAGPRVYGRMAEDGLLPRVFAIHPERTWPPVALQAGLAVFLILVGGVQELLGYLGLTLSLCAAGAVSCLLLGSRGGRPRGLALLPSILFTTATVVLAVLMLVHDPRQGLGTLATVALGVAAYRFSGRARPSPSP